MYEEGILDKDLPNFKYVNSDVVISDGRQQITWQEAVSPSSDPGSGIGYFPLYLNENYSTFPTDLYEIQGGSEIDASNWLQVIYNSDYLSPKDLYPKDVSVTYGDPEQDLELDFEKSPFDTVTYKFDKGYEYSLDREPGTDAGEYKINIKLR